MSRRALGPIRDPDLADERRWGLWQFLGLSGLLTTALILIGPGPAAFVILEVGVLWLVAARIWGTAQLTSSQEYALVLVGRFAPTVVAQLRADPTLGEQWRRAGVDIDAVLALTHPELMRSLGRLRAQGTARRPAFSVGQRVVVTVASMLGWVLLTIATGRPVLLWSPSSCTIWAAPSTLAVLVLIGAGGLMTVSRLVIGTHNNRQRLVLGRYFGGLDTIHTELAELLAPVWTARRRAVIADLNELCRLASTGARTTGPIWLALLRRVPYVVLGTFLALAVTTLVSLC
jgi:hypothetical protein